MPHDLLQLVWVTAVLDTGAGKRMPELMAGCLYLSVATDSPKHAPQVLVRQLVSAHRAKEVPAIEPLIMQILNVVSQDSTKLGVDEDNPIFASLPFSNEDLSAREINVCSLQFQ